MDKKFLKAKDVAQLWGITPRRVNQLCTAGFINGAYKEGRYWLIPSDTTKPEILRNKQVVCACLSEAFAVSSAFTSGKR